MKMLPKQNKIFKTQENGHLSLWDYDYEKTAITNE